MADDKQSTLPHVVNYTKNKEHMRLTSQQNMTFTFVKENGVFTVTECKGALASSLGYERDQVIGKTLHELFPKKLADFKATCYERAWQGEVMTYEAELNDVPFLVVLSPIFEGGHVIEVHGMSIDLIQRVTMEKQLEESEQRFRSLMEHNIDALFSLDLTGTFTSVNEAATHLTGFTEEELLQMSFYPLMVDAVHFPSRFRKALATASGTYDVKLRRKDGEVRLVNLTLTPIIVEEETLGMYCICKDITERKRQEAELRETKELLETLFAHSADMIFIYDFDKRSITLNTAFEETFGWSSDELQQWQSPILPFVVEEGLTEYWKMLETVKAGQPIKGYEMVCRRKDGSLLNTSITLFPLFDQDGRAYAYSGISRDITEKKAQEKALVASEEKYRIIAENTTDLIASVNKQGFLTYLSPSHQTILGADPHVYNHTYAISYIHPDDQERVRMITCQSINDGEPFKFEARWQHQQTKEFFLLETSATPIVGPHGQIDGIVVVSRDLTERIRTEEMLRKSDKLSMLGQLAAGVAHEIRNPLTSIKGFLQLLESRAEEHLDYYTIMLSEIDRINTIVSEFMVLAKPQAMSFVPTNITELMKHVISLIETQAILKNVQIHYSAETGLPLVSSADNQLKQVFINLLKNAIEAMPTGGNIWITVIRDHDQLVISFRDEGCGIPEERLASLGEPFYTTKEKGTGLGLMVCFKIIENHGGKIHVTSTLGKGSKFTVLLPID
ncbi:PAS/PAC sensor signal transduction histidine kinase [Fictibacillus macauensis ZFHKF-1]|uniref:histidine kinase n=2 Tax=Fictibacillus TaxID=1329200 RepID=I8UAK4_9BACL|nr:PAS/PAC sensor signal transduction histidine kinase [Fictibacillus macauensis ZFHKF-1]